MDAGGSDSAAPTDASESDGQSGRDILSDYGGWLLTTWGVALVVLACVFAKQATIAPIFAFTGVALTVLGVLGARFEGDFELSATGLKGRLRATADRDDLTLEDKGEALMRFASSEPRQQLGDSRSQWQAWSTASNSVRRAQEFEAQARRHFEAEGWRVTSTEGSLGPIGDFAAKKDNELLVAEVKARPSLSSADVMSLLSRISRVADSDQVPRFSIALVVPRGSLSPAARQAAREFELPVRVVEL